MSQIENVSRRRFLTGGIIAAGALVLGGRYYRKLSGGKLAHDTNADHATLHPSVYLGIDPDGTVWIVASRSEMGTTSRTTLPLVVADELDADWKRVKVRSEEHTSELQSRLHLVCRLLLEQKKSNE